MKVITHVISSYIIIFKITVLYTFPSKNQCESDCTNYLYGLIHLFEKGRGRKEWHITVFARFWKQCIVGSVDRKDAKNTTITRFNNSKWTHDTIVWEQTLRAVWSASQAAGVSWRNSYEARSPRSDRVDLNFHLGVPLVEVVYVLVDQL